VDPLIVIKDSDPLIVDPLIRGDQGLWPLDPDALFRPSVQEDRLAWFRYTPSIEIAKLRVPVLIAQMSHDFQVMPSEATLLATATPRATTLTVAVMNHILKLTPADRSQQMAGAYLDPAMPLASQFLDSLAAFVGSAAPVRR